MLPRFLYRAAKVDLLIEGLKFKVWGIFLLFALIFFSLCCKKDNRCHQGQALSYDDALRMEAAYFCGACEAKDTANSLTAATMTI